MVVRSYAVITLPAKDTVLGALSEQGCRIELVAAPRRHEALGSCYAVHFTAEGVRAGQAADAERRLQDVFVCLVISHVDAGSLTWTAGGWIPVQNVAVRIFRLLERPPLNMAPPWVVFKDGLAQLRLRPEQGPTDGFLQGLKDCLAGHGIDADVHMVELDDSEHTLRMRSLDDLPEPMLA